DPVAPTRLRLGVPTDLQTICLKCLEKDPPRRYPTALQVAEDLGRFLAGQPIQARPVGAVEWAWKWARRRPALPTLLPLRLAAPLGLLGGGWWSYLALRSAAGRETQERQRADRQRERAERRLRDALDVVDRLLTEVAEIDLVNAPQMEPLRRALLQRAQQFY